MKTLRRFRPLALLTGLLLGLAHAAGAQQVLLKRTYYDLSRRRLHEEYQYIRTAAVPECKHGYYKEYDEQGVLWKKGNYRHNQAEGRQLEYLNAAGQPQLQYDVTVRHGIAHGPYIRYRGANEKMSAGNYVNGSREGVWHFYYAEGYEVCRYQNDKKEGPAALYYTGGKLAEQYAYRNDERYNDGDIQSFYEDGSPKKSGHFTAGLMNGRFRAWYPNGQLRYEENYVDDAPEGRFLAYSEAGELITDDVYAAGRLVEHKQTAREMAEQARQQQYEALRQRQKLQQDSIQQAYARAETDRRQQLEMTQEAEALAKDAALKQETMRNEAAVGYRRQLDPRLYVELYQQLLADYRAATSPADQLTRAKRLKRLLALAVALERGEQPELRKALRKEPDLTKALALTGL
ncbi:toxin-antitoxin system YwqK family antitoxin [Hymenobacter gummosus]|nr:toxin-antitoxin system YwqK family antitoxin [Hymenobacter gummosus]